jgi:hypothetical protein
MKWVACMYTIPYFSEILQLEEIKDLLPITPELGSLKIFYRPKHKGK